MANSRTFKGLIAVNNRYNDGKGVYIIDDSGDFEYPFAEDFPSRANVSVRYAIRDKNEWPETLDEVAAEEMAKLDGIANAEYYSRYSDLTGYLWTTENAKVGGHDLIALLTWNKGKFLWMEIEYEYVPNRSG